MTTAKHTLGPWHLQYDEITDAPDGFSIASVLTHGNERETRANAHLIAASPEMLAALKATLIDMRQMGWAVHVRPKLRESYKRVEDAIRKAEAER